MENLSSKSDEEGNTEVDEVVVVEEGNEELEEEEEEMGLYLKDGEFNVEKILDMKIEKGKKVYYVKWEGYPNSQNTWEPIEHLNSIPTMVEEFEKEFQKKNPPQAKKSVSTNLPEKLRPKESKSLKRFATANLTNETITKKIKGNPKNKTLGEEEYQAEVSSATGDQSPIVEIVEEEKIESKSSSSKANQRKGQKPQAKVVKDAPPKKAQTQKMKDKLGSFKQKDKPLCIKGVKPGKNGEFFFIVEWEKRSDGTKPENSHVSNAEFKIHDSAFLFEFYESKLVIFSRKKLQNSQKEPQVIDEQSPSNENEAIAQSPVENDGKDAFDNPLDSKKFNDKNNFHMLEEMTRELDAQMMSDNDDYLNLNQNNFL